MLLERTEIIGRSMRRIIPRCFWNVPRGIDKCREVPGGTEIYSRDIQARGKNEESDTQARVENENHSVLGRDWHPQRLST